VKLRYGKGPEDNPFLWGHMKTYTELLAGMFAGIRIDNCHSTPRHVGEYLLDAARRVNPNFYVCAELFSGSEEMDLLFVKSLGINSLIRETLNGHDPKDESRLLYIYGLGKPIGASVEELLSMSHPLLEHCSDDFKSQGRWIKTYLWSTRPSTSMEKTGLALFFPIKDLLLTLY
jgi:glycogen debranching enzyme